MDLDSYNAALALIEKLEQVVSKAIAELKSIEAADEIRELKRKLAAAEAKAAPQTMAADPDRTALLLENKGRAILEDRCMHVWNCVAYYGGTSRPFIAQCSKCGTTDPS